MATPIADLGADKGPVLAVELGLRPDEYEHITQILGRTPTICELYMYSLMWSEHCSYKHSKKYLRLFPTTGPHVLQGPGENAGVISVGDGWAVAFKMETHNHPSAIEPYEGAATGIGGIIRDIFTMGARPIACVDSLRFGTLDKPRQRYLFEGAVAGIGGYGNCIGVPTVAGEVYFEPAYEGNCIIGAMSIGLLREENLTRATASGVGNQLVLIGSTTGRDGIGGASVLASQEFDEGAEAKRPAVQVGDPFEEKLLIEACLELLESGLLVGLGDLGAAGLTSSASEMASRAGVGLDIDVAKVPRREPGMQPFEIMVSESQERMLACVEPEKLEAVLAVCDKWGLRATVIGQVTDTGDFVVRDGDALVGCMPALSLADDAPEYDVPFSKPAYIERLAAESIPDDALPQDPGELNEVMKRMLGSHNICSRAWIYEQYDHQVMDNTVVKPGGDAAVLRIGLTGRGARSGSGDSGGRTVTDRGIAVSSDCNGRYCYLNPYRGAQIALAEAARNVSCVGGEPAAITDCLSFGSPDKPEVYWTFVEAIKGLSDGCRSFGIPVISGNVSFYNESFGEPIYPTPKVGLVGLVERLDRVCTADFKDAGDTIILLGQTEHELGGSEYLRLEHDRVAGEIPALDLELERDVQDTVRELVRAGLLKSAHDCSDGGVAVALAESAIGGRVGFEVALDDDLPAAVSLFSETQSRVVVSCDSANVDAVLDAAAAHGIPFSVLGDVGGNRLVIQDKLDLDLDTAADIYHGALEQAVHG
ncbi:MAG: phosphoribosylformylglycinamidine synthase subunit PurL [Actinomycetes bacterium]|jgi:phosphoribosylformylglycinamidine synthase|nr:phosphoribosylformylglycinamidine synthase subunit PurL [Actinomycetes bacterium]